MLGPLQRRRMTWVSKSPNSFKIRARGGVRARGPFVPSPPPPSLLEQIRKKSLSPSLNRFFDTTIRNIRVGLMIW